MNEATVESAAVGVRYVRAVRILSNLGFVGLFASLTGAAVLRHLPTHIAPPLFFLAYLGWFIPWLTSYILWFLEPKKRGRIAFGGDGTFTISRGAASHVLTPANVESAQSVVRADGPRVEIVLENSNVFSIAVPSESDADAIVGRVGFGPGGRRQRFELAARKRRFLHLALGLAAYQGTTLALMPFMVILLFTHGSSAMPILMGSIPFLLPFIYRFFRKKVAAPRVEVGDDGISITIGTRAPRFLARKDVYRAEVIRGTGNIALSTAEGPTMISALSLDAAVSTAAIHATERRWSATAAAPGPRVATFERWGRPLEIWRAELASKIADAGYRGDGITVEEADATLRNAGASAEARLGAAFALAAAGQRVRIAEAAAPIADQRLRVALESVAEGREELALLEAATAEPKMLERSR